MKAYTQLILYHCFLPCVTSKLQFNRRSLLEAALVFEGVCACDKWWVSWRDCVYVCVKGLGVDQLSTSSRCTATGMGARTIYARQNTDTRLNLCIKSKPHTSLDVFLLATTPNYKPGDLNRSQIVLYIIHSLIYVTFYPLWPLYPYYKSFWNM